MYSCDSFEGAADYLGRNMKPGVKGATINAIGSSLPELFTTAIFLFGPHFSEELFGKIGQGFAAGIATCAGSAVFNAVIIPAFCIFFVFAKGVRTQTGFVRVREIVLNRRVVFKDGLFFLLATSLLIFFLSMSFETHMTWWMGSIFLAVYGLYMFMTLRFDDVDQDAAQVVDSKVDSTEEESGWGILGLGWLLDINERFYRGREYDTRRAWVVLLTSVIAIGLACAGIAWGVETIAHCLSVPSYFTAVILAAAATSVPDTALSVKDALKGDYDDALANAIGSNIFDICVCIGLPLLVYTLCYGPLPPSRSAGEIQLLQWMLLVVTCVVLAVFLLSRRIGLVHGVALSTVYIVWTTFVVGRGCNADWTRPFAEFVHELHAPTVITMSEYRRVDYGMSVDEVLDVVGSGCDRLSHADLMPNNPEHSMSVYACMNAFGSNGLFTFVGDKLRIKVQVGL